MIISSKWRKDWTVLWSLRVGQERNVPAAANHHLYATVTVFVPIYSCPGRHFEGNQLLGCSISLSPLYTRLTSDLHVSNASSFHKAFASLHSSMVKIASLSGLTNAFCAPQWKASSSSMGRSRLMTIFAFASGSRFGHYRFSLMPKRTPQAVFQDGSKRSVLLRFSRQIKQVTFNEKESKATSCV